ncbi:MAG: twin-arginine translocation signal domain-containing protein, partial [Chloroflexota bacterium]|nr:twin-arginine translocation signal domain-containing protein [Chloroflexota bacterium]
MPVEHERGGPEKVAAEAARLWPLARGRGMYQRQFLQLLAAGGAAAVLAACTGPGGRRPSPAASEADDAKAWFKDTAPFIVHDDGKSLEARLENMEGLITPNQLFFVRNNSVSLDVDVASWR